MCNYTAVPIKDVGGVEYTLYRECVGGVCLVCYFSLLGLLLFSLLLSFYLLFHSFIHIHPSISSPLSSDTLLRGRAVKILRSLESFGSG